MADSDKYQAGGIRPPSIPWLRQSADKLGFDLSDAELEDYREMICGVIPHFSYTDRMPDPCPKVKYARTPGYRPTPEENKHNGWYWKTDIHGASEGLLQGKKVAIKDTITVAGVPMMAGSKVMEGYMPEFDATVVTRILDAGGVICGKATCEDLCLSGSSITNAKGLTHNPRAPGHVTGGSSSGCAALLANGDVDIALGTDQGGSIRIPASWCGIVGLKPTFGLVPYTGAMCLEPTIDHIGPMARTVKDVALLLEVIAGPDDLDDRQPTSYKVPKYSENLDSDVRSIKIGLLTEGFDICQEEVNAIVHAAVGKCRDAGAMAEMVSVADHKAALSLWECTLVNGLWSTVIDGTGNALGRKTFYSTSLCEHARRGFKAHANDLSPGAKYLFLAGDYVKSNYGNRFYHKAQNLCPMITKAYNDALDKYDVLLMPTLPYPAPSLLKKDCTMEEYKSATLGMVANTGPFDYTGHPALTLNVGYTSEGLPIGAMLVGKMFDEMTILKVAHCIENVLK